MLSRTQTVKRTKSRQEKAENWINVIFNYGNVSQKKYTASATE